MIALLLAAALTSQTPDTEKIFKDEVAAQAQRMGIPVPRVMVTAARPWLYDQWAWVDSCPYQQPCAPVIEIRQDVLAVMGYWTLRILAAHEMQHVQRGHHLDIFWSPTFDHFTEVLEARAHTHAEIKKAVNKQFGDEARAALAVDLARWEAQWTARWATR